MLGPQVRPSGAGEDSGFRALGSGNTGVAVEK